MAPNGYIMAELGHEEPVSRTYQYRKVMKPMLERKRRARINRCLDELKELMVGALQSDGENVSKLEKADILELTVRHLHGLKRSNQLVAKPEMTYADRFRSGFTQCAAEVSQFLSTAVTPEGVRVDRQSGVKLMQHLGGCIRRLDVPVQQSQTQQLYHVEHTPVPSKQLAQPKQHFVTVPNAMYTPPSSPGHHTVIGGDTATMWRPW